MRQINLEAAEIRDAVRAGLYRAWHNHFVMTDEIDEDIVPEYLTTAAVCYALADHIKGHGLRGLVTVRAEELTRLLWGKFQLPAFLGGKRKSDLKANSDRPGNVDISMAIKRSEFGENGDLYKHSRGEIKKDLLRNTEFIVGHAGRGVEYSAFTFYLRDVQSVLKSDGDDYRRRMSAFFQNEAESIIGPQPGLSVVAEVGSLSENLFATNEAAMAPDENGAPAVEMQGHSHIAYGIISIFKPGEIVVNEGKLGV
jgi:hypothetical protein